MGCGSLSPEASNPVRLFEFYLRRVNHLLNQATRKYLAQYGLSLPRFWVLLTLKHLANPTMSELQKHLYLAPSTLTGLVDGLVDAGLIIRERDADDRRVVRLRLTQAGEEQLGRVLAYKEELLGQATSQIGSSELDRINQHLHSIYANLEAKLREA